jgi:hypothetical protein
MSPPGILSFTDVRQAQLLDLCSLRADMDFPPHWLEQLIFQGALRETITPNATSEFSLRHFFFEIRNQDRLGGQCSLTFGFPAVQLATPDGPLFGPLLCWPLQLEPGPNAGKDWLITHEPRQGLYINPVMAEAIQAVCGYSLPDLPASKGKDQRPAGNDLMAWIAETARITGLSIDTEQPAARPFDDSRHKQPASPGAILWSGWLGLRYPIPPAGALDALPELVKTPPMGHPLGLFRLDPWQASVFLETRQSSLTLARGITGSGKTHLIAHLISNALSNGQTCLVVSERLPGLQEAQALLNKSLVGPRDLLLRDAGADKDNFLAFLKLAISNSPVNTPFPADQFRVLAQKTTRLHEKLDNAYTLSHRPIFGHYNWIESTGLYLESQQKAGKELLGQQVVHQDFSFTYEEHQQLRREITTSQALFGHAGTLKHPLTALYHAHFLHRELAQSRPYVTQQLQAFLSRAGKLHLRYINTINQYSDKLTERFQTGFQQLHNDLFMLKGLIADAKNQFGRDVETNSIAGLKIRRLFSEKARNMLQARAGIKQAFSALMQNHAAGAYFSFDAFNQKMPAGLPASITLLANFEQALNDWHQRVPDIIQEELRRLNSRSVHPAVPMAGEALDIEQALDVFINDLNEAAILEQPLVNNMLTLPKKLQRLEDIAEQLEQITLYLKDFDHFYVWQRHWLLMSDKGRTIVRALVKVKPTDWAAALDSWFYYQCLAMHYATELPGTEMPIDDYAQAAGTLQTMMPAQIDALWEEKRLKAIRAIRKNAPKTLRTLHKDPQHLTLEACWATLGHELTQLFPVVYATPAAAAVLGTVFDYLIVDEAQTIAAGTGQALLSAGRQTLIMADQPILSTADRGSSLMDALMAQGHPVHELGMVHQVKPGNLLQSAYSAKAADHTDRPLQLNLTYVHGFYQPDTGINEKEAQQVIQLLNQVSLTPQRTLPTIGIVCTTSAQRDLISDYLLRIKQRNDAATELIQQLERNGLGVFHLAELDGLHFDEIIFSVTVGPDHPRQNSEIYTDIFDSPAMIARLATLMGRSHRQMTALCSIDELSLRHIAQQEKQGPALLANFLLFAEAFSKFDGAQQRRIIERVTQQFGPQQHTPSPSVFYTFLAEALRPYLGDITASTTLSVDHTTLPLVFQLPSGNTPLAALWADGSFMETPHTDWLWEHQLMRALQEKNIPIIPVSSTACWRDGREEIRKIAGTLLQLSHGGAD